MSANSLSDSSTAKSRSDKGGKPSLTITLRLPSARLLPFADKPATMRKTTKGRSSLAATVDTVEATPATSTPASPENGVDASASPANPDTKEVVDSDTKKSTPGPKTGTKRGLGPDGMPKPRGKPGPKRRKLDEGAEGNGGTPVAAHKLGPKANQGAINAGLRALDRSGKPCRRWEKKPMIIKSFTGVTWPLHSWGSQARVKADLQNGDSEKSSSAGGQENGQVNGKDGVASSSAVESEKSNNGDVTAMNASSPPVFTESVATPTAVMAEG